MNYLLFYPDEMRAESLACYGHPVVQTPNFDRVAAEGAVFENAYSTHPVCAPSRASLVTGWFPHVQGHRTLRYLLDETTPNFFKYLREAGFTTCLAGKNHCFTDKATDASFDRATATFLPKGQDLASFIAGEPTGGNYTMLRPPLPQEEMADDNDFRYVDEGVKFIRDCAREGKPFFLFQSLNSPHPPYRAAERYYDMYDPDKLPPLRDLRWLEGDALGRGAGLAGSLPGMTDAHEVVAAYWAAAEARDWDVFGTLLAEDVIYRGPQTREQVRGRDAYLRFNVEGFAYDWHVAVQQIIGEGQHAASWIEFTGHEGTQPGLCFFDLRDDGKISRITDFWPDPYELPASRAHLVERY